MIRRKPEVKVTGSDAQMTIERKVELVFEGYHALPVLVTSGNDGKHKENSRHFTNEAEDFSIRVLIEKLHEDLEKELGLDFDVVYEPDTWAMVDGELKKVKSQHFHVEYDPKGVRRE